MYLDINSPCDHTFYTIPYCPGDGSVTVTAPPGYLAYEWSDINGAILGANQTLTIAPPPPSGTVYNVKLNPFYYIGGPECLVNLSTTVNGNLDVTAHAGFDVIQCDKTAHRLGGPPYPGLTYSWSPTTGLSDPHASNPLADVTATTQYVLTVKSLGGGCTDTDTTVVTRIYPDNTITQTGGGGSCAEPQPVYLHVNPLNITGIQWYNLADPVAGATGPDFQPGQTGYYHAELTSVGGCILNTALTQVNIYPIPEAKFTVNNIVQCYGGNEFILTDTSHYASAGLHYSWDFGDGHVAGTRDATHSYASAGTYVIRFRVSADGGCTDERTVTVTVKPGAVSNFSAADVCVDLPVNFKNTTLSPGATTVFYHWDFGNGDVSSDIDPQYTYHVPGTYTVKLSVNTPECPDLSVKEQKILIDEPHEGIRYADQEAILNFPLKLESRGFGKYYLWSPGIYLNRNDVRQPLFRSFTENEYTIKITTATGCITVDTGKVTIKKLIDIYVPGAFTPNGDGKNDRLKPLLYGFRKVNYFRVYNREGSLLYASESDEPGWDGMYRGVKQEMQTVVWILEAEDADGKIHQAKGTTVLMR